MRKQPFLFLFLIAWLAAANHANSQELPLFGQLPKPGKHWLLHKQGAINDRFYACSWAVLTNSQTGDMLSFVADKYDKAVRTVRSDPTRQAAVDMFPGGYPRFMRDAAPGLAGWIITDTIRFNVVELTAFNFNSGTKKNVLQDSLEYTYVYEDESKAASNRMAHGYVLAFGELVVFVQHTSTHAITSELAKSMAESLIIIRSEQKTRGNSEGEVQLPKRESTK